MKRDYTFISWELSEEDWKAQSWFDKVRAIILFKIILPKSKLTIKNKPIGELHRIE